MCVMNSKVNSVKLNVENITKDISHMNPDEVSSWN